MAWTGRTNGTNVLSLLKWVANGFDFDFILSFVSMHMTFLSHKSQRSSKIALCPINCPADLLFKEVVQFHYFESTNPGCAEDLSFVACLRPFFGCFWSTTACYSENLIYSIFYFESTISGHAEFLWVCPLSPISGCFSCHWSFEPALEHDLWYQVAQNSSWFVICGPQAVLGCSWSTTCYSEKFPQLWRMLSCS